MNELKVTPEFFDQNPDYILVKYNVFTRMTGDDRWDKLAEYICYGQSIGNISIRNEWETPEMIAKHACKYYYETDTTTEDKELTQILVVGFPACNFSPNLDGLTQILCSIMGGQVDVDGIDLCRVVDINLPDSITEKLYIPPSYGLLGLRELMGAKDKPILGAIIKPKIGMNPSTLLEQVKQIVDNGIQWIKEDEILGDPDSCPLEERVPLIMDYINKLPQKVLYHVNVNADPGEVLGVVDDVVRFGGTAVHINLWAGPGVYRSIARHNLETGNKIAIHVQKSGDKIYTHPGNKFGIDWVVLCKLLAYCGIDTIHAGMIMGYGNDDEQTIYDALNVLRNMNVMPALSCGLGPHNLQKVIAAVGTDFLANAGGNIHGHPGGTAAGVTAMKQALDGNHGPEYKAALKKTGKNAK